MSSKRIIPLVFIFSLLAGTLSAQDGYMVQGDLLTMGIELSQPSGLKKYHQVIVDFGKPHEATYTANDLDEFGIGEKIFVSMPSPMPGNTTRIFLYQLIKKDSVTVYQYEDQTGEHFFFRRGNAPLEEITATRNPYADYLAELHAREAGHPIQAYTIKPTASSLLMAEKLSRTGNSNLLTRFRYGVWVGGGISSLSKDVLPANGTKGILLGGIFANLPVYRQLSLQTELFYWQEAYSYSRDSGTVIDDKVFNRKSIALPIMARYSFIQLKGKFIPYLQAGPSLLYGLKKKCEEQGVVITSDNVNTSYSLLVDEKGFFYTGLNIGAGTEYKLNRRHSLFLDARFLTTFDDEASSLIYTTLSFNF